MNAVITITDLCFAATLPVTIMLLGMFLGAYIVESPDENVRLRRAYRGIAFFGTLAIIIFATAIRNLV